MCDFSQYGGPSDEWLAVEAGLPSAPAELSVAERKTTTNQVREDMSLEAMKTMADHVIVRNWTIPTRDGSTIEGRSYRPKAADDSSLPVYLYLHGGGFLFGTVNSEDAACSRIAISTSVLVVSVNYRHTPDFIYPTAWNDVEDGFQWLHANIAEIGGCPEKHLGNFGKDLPPIAGQVLIIPCLVNPDCYDGHLKRLKHPAVSSYAENENAPILPRRMIELFVGLLKIEKPDYNDLRLNPGNVSAELLKGMPPTTLGIAGLDPLRDEGLLYAKLLTESGVPTETHIFRGVPHGFRRFGDKLSESKHWDNVTDNGIKWALTKPTPSGQFVILEA
ncbi:hypothetical protein CcaCcLH18_01412 [Colletotrichum camelliae]|nr:hypothetical protein CcaCcLH18_01412 [Colletotrichum camelliae]